MMCGSRDNELGYTLVEAIVGIALLSFIVVALSGGLRFGTRIWANTNSSVVLEEQRDIGSLLLRALLPHAIPIEYGDDVEFAGDAQSIAFDAPAPVALGVPGLARIWLFVERSGGKQTMRVRVQSARRPTLVREARTVLTGAPRFSYLDASAAVPVWLDRWHDRDRLPDAVRLADDEQMPGKGFVGVIVRLPIAQAPDCVFDPVSLSCRRT